MSRSVSRPYNTAGTRADRLRHFRQVRMRVHGLANTLALDFSIREFTRAFIVPPYLTLSVFRGE